MINISVGEVDTNELAAQTPLDSYDFNVDKLVIISNFLLIVFV